jgi:hypothetical protein
MLLRKACIAAGVHPKTDSRQLQNEGHLVFSLATSTF